MKSKAGKSKAALAKEAKRLRNKAWKELSAETRAKAGRCEVCGALQRLACHHVLPKKQHPALWLEPRDLVVLCPRCHYKVHHGHEWEFAAWLQANKPEQWAWICEQAAKNGF